MGKIIHNYDCSFKAKPVKAINCTTKKASYHSSMKSAGRKLNVIHTSIKYVCDKKHGHKYAYKRH